mgnify:CR=1 FL=1
MVVVDILFISFIVVDKFSDLMCDTVIIKLSSIILISRTHFIGTITTESFLGVVVVFFCASTFQSILYRVSSLRF